jgi:hypothetical protein
MDQILSPRNFKRGPQWTASLSKAETVRSNRKTKEKEESTVM